MVCSLKSNQYDVTKPHSIYVFDVESDGMLSNRRLFAAVGVYDGSSPGLGIPDGIKVDSKDRVYVATVDGIQGMI
jgi:sugar lactone lactonase YvrE